MITKFAWITSLFCLLIFNVGQSVTAQEQQRIPLKIVLVSPNDNDEDFWGQVHSFAKASAEDLGIDLTVVLNEAGNRYSYLALIKKVMSAQSKPDAILAILYRGISANILQLSNEYKVPIFIINSPPPEDSAATIGLPRQYFKNYLGLLAPNEKKVGYLLAKHLIQVARANHPSQVIEVVGISGTRDSTAARQRNAGLRAAAAEQDNVVLKQIVYGHWEAENAHRKARLLLDRYVNLAIIWNASDLMALSAAQAIRQSPYQNILSGGVDWTKEAIFAVNRGRLAASIGGHFTDGGFALVMLYDYFNGIDFKQDPGLTSDSSLALLHSTNIHQYYDFLIQQNWQAVNFRKYSKVYQPAIKKYNFSFSTLLLHQAKEKP